MLPSEASQASEVAIIVMGENFSRGDARLYLAEGVDISDGEAVTSSTITATLRVGCDAEPGSATLQYALPTEDSGTECSSLGRACWSGFSIVENTDCGIDADEDGVPLAEDCDDNNAQVYAGATERCDGVDNNCDGSIDNISEGTCSGPTAHSGTLAADEIWTAEAGPHTITSAITISAGITLTIEAGATVTVDPGASIRVYGALNAVGTAAQPIVITSAQSTRAPGDWSGLRFYDGSTGALDYVEISYASTGMTLENTDASVTHSKILSSSSYGLELGWEDSAAPGDPSRFSNNTIRGGSTYPVYTYLERVNLLDSSNTFSGNATDSIYVRATSNHTECDITMQALDVPYTTPAASSGQYIYFGSTTATPTLTIESGAQWELSESLMLGYSAGEDATVFIEAGSELSLTSSSVYVGNSGTAQLLVELGATLGFYGGSLRVYADSILSSAGVFTSSATSPSSSDWSGVDLHADSHASISSATVEYANTCIDVYEGSHTITSTTIQHCSDYGIYVQSGASPSISGITFSDNGEDLFYEE